ncbi:aspartate aminotransferase, cytoplasmic-like [Uloborus diversus]|uniref:aspartate aminotransferase, cytoplasmic-like n=1 Tax=Uloborus diversus TaxID=327109 RepID=UPI00240A9768|nr:aspartate aminotransferase, cytoplasmic-like [Uloborus diversus]
MTSRFAIVKPAPPVEMFALNKACEEDVFPDKVNLSIGAYRSEEGKPWVLPVVRKAETSIAEDETLNHEYLGQLGLKEFTKAATRLLLGENSPAIKENRVLGVQALSGTGALRLGADFLATSAHFTDYYLSDPTWPNHPYIFRNAGFKHCHTYRYWNPLDKALDFKGMLEDLENAPEDSVVVLHVCGHNPTGVDPTQEEWKRIADVMEKRKLFPFLDCAYQGFASGDLERDSWPVRYFVRRGFELFCAQSFAKNLGLYNERVGNLTVVVKDPAALANIESQVTFLVRGNYSNPPCHGVRIVTRILNDPTLFAKWQEQMTEMSGRIIKMRAILKQKLDELDTPGKWNHITAQTGMFSYTGLNPLQVKYLIEEHHIYLAQSGRISICGLNSKNVDYVARAFHDAVTKVSETTSSCFMI